MCKTIDSTQECQYWIITFSCENYNSFFGFNQPDNFRNADISAFDNLSLINLIPLPYRARGRTPLLKSRQTSLILASGSFVEFWWGWGGGGVPKVYFNRPPPPLDFFWKFIHIWDNRHSLAKVVSVTLCTIGKRMQGCSPILVHIFLSDPGIPGVRSMGPSLSNWLRYLFETFPTFFSTFFSTFSNFFSTFFQLFFQPFFNFLSSFFS